MSSAPSPSSAWKSQRLWISIALAVLVFAVFGNTLRNDFVDFDDNAYVYDNPDVTEGLTWAGARWAFSGRTGRTAPPTAPAGPRSAPPSAIAFPCRLPSNGFSLLDPGNTASLRRPRRG